MVTAGLQPLEFTDCLLDSPEFRENLNKHEKELEKTSQQIKRIIKEVKDLLAAAKREFTFQKIKMLRFQGMILMNRLRIFDILRDTRPLCLVCLVHCIERNGW